MKKISVLFSLCFTIIISFAQNVPQGMKYQAVARSLSGSVLANQQVSLQINLVSQQGNSSTVYYSEVHNVTTNELGLFTISIGEGKANKGGFSAVPWSSEEIWMQVAIKDNGKADFVTISNSKLLTVPYAFHAETASSIVNNDANTGALARSGDPVATAGVPAAAWSVKGNSATSPLTDKLGTTDLKDLILVTNNIERIRILANGNVDVKNSMTVGNELVVKQNVKLNTLGGTTNIKGLTEVNNNTESTTPYNGALVVDGGVGIGGNLNVAGATNFGSVNVSSSITAQSLNMTDNTVGFVATLTNTNSGEGDGLKIKLGRTHPMWNGSAYESIEVDDFNPVYKTFKPQIATVKKWLDDQEVSITSADILSLLESTGKFLGGALCQLTNALSPLLNEKIGLPVDISTPVNTALKLPFNVSSPINNGIGLPLNVSTPINNGIGLPFSVSGPINTGLNLPFDLTAPINTGLSLPVRFSILDIVNQACDVCVDDDDVAGSYFSLVPALPTLKIPAVPDLKIPAIPKFEIPAIPTLIIPAIPAFSIPEIPQIDCGGLPQIGAPTILTSSVSNSLTLKNEYVKFVDKEERTVGIIRAVSISDFRNRYLSNAYLFELVAAVGGLDIARGLINLASQFNKIAHNYNVMGVEYVSGNGDYAEWMQRENLEEVISPGDIVGVKGGKITKDLKGAEQIMAVSTQPIVSANMPEESMVALGNSIAFMGQIPVKIMGAVTTGDFIVAKGDLPGYGVAVKSSDMTTEDFRLVVGRAWETKPTVGPKMVNTLVGVQNNDFLKIIQKYQQKVMSAEERVANAEERLNAIEKRLNMKALVKKGTKTK